jgi:hypothetical protein
MTCTDQVGPCFQPIDRETTRFAHDQSCSKAHGSRGASGCDPDPLNEEHAIRDAVAVRGPGVKLMDGTWLQWLLPERWARVGFNSQATSDDQIVARPEQQRIQVRDVSVAPSLATDEDARSRHRSSRGAPQ